MTTKREALVHGVASILVLGTALHLFYVVASPPPSASAPGDVTFYLGLFTGLSVAGAGAGALWFASRAVHLCTQPGRRRSVLTRIICIVELLILGVAVGVAVISDAPFAHP